MELKKYLVNQFSTQSRNIFRNLSEHMTNMLNPLDRNHVYVYWATSQPGVFIWLFEENGAPGKSFLQFRYQEIIIERQIYFLGGGGVCGGALDFPHASVLEFGEYYEIGIVMLECHTINMPKRLSWMTSHNLFKVS